MPLVIPPAASSRLVKQLTYLVTDVPIFVLCTVSFLGHPIGFHGFGKGSYL